MGYSEVSADSGVSATQQAAIDAKVSDTAYNATSWNSVTTVAPSKNAVRDYLETLIAAVSAIAASAIDWSLLLKTGGIYTKTLSANTTITFSNPTAGQTIVIRLTNTASNYTVTWPTIRWAGGAAPTMTVGAKSDVYTILYDGSNYYGSAVQNMS